VRKRDTAPNPLAARSDRARRLREHTLPGDGQSPGAAPHPAPRGKYLAGLALAALGVVYGDIGTSPLYALRECFHGEHAMVPTPANVLGILSLIFWSLILIISVKYLAYVMRADNRGEGGILALMSLVPGDAYGVRRNAALVALGLFGAALLYGDGMIQPAISVLSAVEGLEVATPLFQPYVVPITLLILIGLFLFQRRGTAGIGAIFGPVMLVWFFTLAALGIRQILRTPEVLAAVNPAYAWSFFADHRLAGFLVLGSVFLVVTGGESLYADMGHFGRAPIRWAWFVLVLPSLLLNYFGQGALLYRDPSAAVNPFYRLAPEGFLYPLVALAAVAAVIAAQAVISGAFSLTRQAVQLGFVPRVEIIHTSAIEIGQIYIPAVNWGLMFATLGLVIGFQKSSNLAAAYGVAVTTTMVITAILAYVVARRMWRIPRTLALLITLPFLAIDLAFFGANIVKIPAGGWFPLVVAAAIYTAMMVWKDGRELLGRRQSEGTLPIDLFLKDVDRRAKARVPGTAVFLTTNAEGTPRSLLHNFKHNKVIHQTVLFLSIRTEEIPHVARRDRLEIHDLGNGFHRILARYGFMEDPDVPQLLEMVRLRGLEFDPGSVSYFLGRDTLIATRRQPGMSLWREKLFVLMKRNALGAERFFKLPPNRVIELGGQIEL
jgi:KUP system potassium uptake protein